MATNDGEFELVLGNRQLISVFLIMVILLGVFFSMGYIVGRNSAPAAVTAETRNAPAKPIVVEPQRNTETAPVQTPAAEAEKPAPAPPPAAQKSEPEPAQETPVVRGSEKPSPGTYWQVVATTRPEAEIVAEALAKKGLHALVAQAPKAGLYRVLVGPLSNASATAKTRTDLEAAGFKQVILQKY